MHFGIEIWVMTAKRLQPFLARIQAEYEKLPEASILRNNVRQQISAIHEFYLDWNSAHQRSDPSAIVDFRRDQLRYIKTRRKAVNALVSKYVTVVEAELGLDFSSRLFSIMGDLPSQDKYFPRVSSCLTKAQKRFLPGATALVKNVDIPLLDPVREFLLCVRKVTKTRYFEQGDRRETLVEWARGHLVGLDQQQLIRFRAALLMQRLPSETKITKEIIIELSEKALDLSEKALELSQKAR